MNVKFLLAVSLIANLALAATIAWMAKSKAAGIDGVKPADALQTSPKSTANAPAKLVLPDSVAPSAAPAQSFGWQMVESEDYKNYIANLRAIGCPEETIRDIITADVNKLYESKRTELAGPKKKFEFGNPAD